MSLVTVYTAINATDAQLARARLEAAGFHAVIAGELASFSVEGYALTVGGIRVQVPAAEAEDARLLLSDAPEDPPPHIPPAG